MQKAMKARSVAGARSQPDVTRRRPAAPLRLPAQTDPENMFVFPQLGASADVHTGCGATPGHSVGPSPSVSAASTRSQDLSPDRRLGRGGQADAVSLGKGLRRRMDRGLRSARPGAAGRNPDPADARSCL